VRIIASIFIIPLTFLLFQPLLGNNNANEPMKGCHSTKCHKDKEKKATGRCENCNPFMACSLCNFFTNVRHTIDIKTATAVIQKISLINDNRLVFRSSDCWHPPEFA
jgi:hypothetical protein